MGDVEDEEARRQARAQQACRQVLLVKYKQNMQHKELTRARLGLGVGTLRHQIAARGS
jgi:hypothetical protein